jgi:transcriptional regulator with XRE-family HTH domain
MSELYLVLRRRLAQVTDWVTLGTDVMKKARTTRGLSYEAVARALHVSAKTYERYEKRGRVPVNLLLEVAEVLGLEIEEPERFRVAVSDPRTDLRDLQAEYEAQLRRFQSLNDELATRLRDLPQNDGTSRPARTDAAPRQERRTRGTGP